MRCVMSDVEMMQCVVMSDVVVKCNAEYGWCGVKYAMMMNVGVVWNSCVYGMVRDVDCGCVMWNMYLEMTVGGRLRRNVMSDVEYGGPRWDMLQH